MQHSRMNSSHAFRAALAALATLAGAAGAAIAQSYETQVVASGLNRPTGIAIRGNNTVFFTEVPTPGVPGDMGGMNGVRRLNLRTGNIQTLNMGEPEPINLAHARDGSLYWTWRSAGVILERTVFGEISPFLTGLTRPNGIGVSFQNGNVYFTMLPTPGVPGSAGGTNTVNVSDGETITQLTIGEPEPTDIVVARNGDAYWTCRSAGVILRRSAAGDVSLFLRGLNKPVGIAIDRRGETLYFTEVPTPGVPGSMGGGNIVWAVDIETQARAIVDFGDPEPTDIAVAHNGRLYWTCTSAGVIVEARLRGEHATAGDPQGDAELQAFEKLDQIEESNLLRTDDKLGRTAISTLP